MLDWIEQCLSYVFQFSLGAYIISVYNLFFQGDSAPDSGFYNIWENKGFYLVKFEVFVFSLD